MSEEVYKYETPGVHTIIHKKGIDEKPLSGYEFNGTIDAPRRYIDKHTQESLPAESVIVYPDSFLIINREEKSVTFYANKSDAYRSIKIAGKLELDPEFVQWGFNGGSQWNHKQLAEFIKMNRSCFEDKNVAMKAFTDLKDIEVKIDAEVQKMDDNRANVRTLAAQRVTSSLPEFLVFNVRIFKGQEKQVFKAELYINNSTYDVSLISPDAKDYIDNLRDQVIDSEKEAIKILTPQLTIIEQ